MVNIIFGIIVLSGLYFLFGLPEKEIREHYKLATQLEILRFRYRMEDRFNKLIK